MNPANAMRGVLAMVVAMALFITNDLFLKLATAHLPVGEVLGLRSLFAALVLGLLLVLSGETRRVRLMARRSVAVRSSLDSLTTFTYVIALAVLPLATTTTIYMAAPLITTALAMPLLGERVGFKQWCAILVGFAGAVIVTHPDPDTFDFMALLPLMAAAFGSLRDISTRSIPLDVPGSVVAFASSLCLAFCGLMFAFWETWSVPDLTSAAYIAGSGVSFAFGNLLLVYAFRSAPVRLVSPLRYVLVPCALIYGYLIFNHLPDAWATVGTVLVVGAGLYSIQQEALKGHRAAKQERKETALRVAAAAALPPVKPVPGCGGTIAGAITRAPDHS